MPINAATHIQKTAPGPPAVIASATPAGCRYPRALQDWYTMTEMRLNRPAVDECYFKTFAKLADVAKLHKSGAKSEPTTCAEEQVNHYRSPKDAVNKGEKIWHAYPSYCRSR